ncbi:MAG: DUF1015 domain-containing protein [Gemmatimonadota bacterium]|nr:MAG: DUF1015 domain-containing protein [Gemmatimonadota bacterium]
MPDTPSSPLVAPFVGERYATGESLSNLLAPPYDVISTNHRRALAGLSAHNIVRLILPEGNDDRYENAASLLATWRDDQILVRDERPSVYVLQQKLRSPGARGRTRTGVIGAVAVEPFSRERVRPHEKTHAEPKADRLALLRATNSMFEALLLLARDESDELRHHLSEVVSHEPTVTAELDDIDIRLWQVSGSQGEKIAQAAGAGSLYIADGHHRYETAVAYRQENPSADRTLGLVVPLKDPGLTVLPTHRLIYGDTVDVDGVLAVCRERFHVHELRNDVNYAEHLAEMKNRGTACIVVQPGANAVSLLLKAGAKLGDLPFANEPAVASLEIARIDEMVVKRLLATSGQDAHLGYSDAPDQVIDEVVNGTAAAGVMLNATSVEQVLAVADAGAVMPQKATYFTPKVPSGLVMLDCGRQT